MKSNRLKQALLCATLLSSCLVSSAMLTAQTTPEEKEPAPEKNESLEKEVKKPKDHAQKLEKLPDEKSSEPGGRGPVTKLRDKMLFKKGVKPGTKIPFLGVVLGPVDESLRSQLGLPEGVGVLVRAVMDDSPAAKAGVMQHDVLHYFNDQLLVNEPQLQTLVQQGGIGSEVKLTLFRKGKSEVIHLKLGEILASEEREVRDGPPMFHRFMAPAPTGHGGDVLFTAPVRSPEVYEREVREFQERLQKLHGRSEEMRREIERFTARMQEAAKAEASRKKEIQNSFQGMSGGESKVRVQILTDGEGDSGAVASAISSAVGKDGTTYISHNNMTVTKWKNDQGSGELKVENGRKHLIVKDAEGKEVFSGPVDTPEQRQKLPPEVREQLERIEKGVKVDIRAINTPAADSGKNQGD